MRVCKQEGDNKLIQHVEFYLQFGRAGHSFDLRGLNLLRSLREKTGEPRVRLRSESLGSMMGQGVISLGINGSPDGQEISLFIYLSAF